MRRITILFISLIVALPLTATRAFPGAEGWGAISKGGRGGKVVEVTNLKEWGPGSLRWALENVRQPRTVVFRVAGTITLHYPIRITSPYVTVAGQTSPGGVTLRGENMDFTLLEVATHDVVIRFIRLRPGYRAPDCAAVRIINFTDSTPVYNVILDHCSISWNTDEGVDLWGWRANIHHITVQYCLIAEGLYGHSTAILTGGNSSPEASLVEKVDFHHNLIMNMSHRLPLVKTPSFRFINNIVYNWFFYATQIIGGVKADIVGNFYRKGPLYGKRFSSHSIQVAPASGTDAVSGTPSIYVKGNSGPYNQDPDKDNWSMVYQVAGENGAELRPAPRSFRRATPLPSSPYPITVYSREELQNLLLKEAGASMRLNEMGFLVESRDRVDARLIKEYQERRGRIPYTEEEVGGYPEIKSAAPYEDRDHDGMADRWERLVGMDPSNPTDANKKNLSKVYTNLEVFLSGASWKLIKKRAPGGNKHLPDYH